MPLETVWGQTSYAQLQFGVDDNAVRQALVLIWINLDRDGRGPPETVPLRGNHRRCAQTKRSGNGVVGHECKERAAIIENMLSRVPDLICHNTR
jgi:hypothetical protein